MRTITKTLRLALPALAAVALVAPAGPGRAAKKPATRAEKEQAALVQQAAAHLKAGRPAAAKEVLDRAAALKGLSAEKRFLARALAAGTTGVTDLPAMREQIRLAAAADKASPAARAAAFEQGAKLFNEAHRDAVVREFLKLADQLLVARPKHVYRCRYMAQAPLGAAGWALSKLLKDPKYREARFGPYDKAHAQQLVTDVSGQRGAQEGGGSEEQRQTAFYMVHDSRGWHIFVLSQEPDIEAIRDAGGGAGSLEMAFSPGFEGACYYQWIANLAENEVHLYDWSSPHRHFRSLKGRLRCETVGLKGAFGTHIFIPWISLYDKLPLDGGKWPFSVIRWKKGGGVTWGGKVHEIGRWGLVEWEKPPPPQKRAIQVGILKRAWGVYAKARAAQVRYWQDPEVGDPVFYKEALAPAIQRLDECGTQLKDTARLTPRQITRLLQQAVPDWMEFDYAAAELRAGYLRKKLMAP